VAWRRDEGLVRLHRTQRPEMWRAGVPRVPPHRAVRVGWAGHTREHLTAVSPSQPVRGRAGVWPACNFSRRCAGCQGTLGQEGRSIAAVSKTRGCGQIGGHPLPAQRRGRRSTSSAMATNAPRGFRSPGID
jgi:hypothetical protein